MKQMPNMRLFWYAHQKNQYISSNILRIQMNDFEHLLMYLYSIYNTLIYWFDISQVYEKLSSNIRKISNVNQAKEDKLYDHNQLNPEQHLAKSNPSMIRTLNKLREEHPHIDKEHLQKAHKKPMKEYHT